MQVSQMPVFVSNNSSNKNLIKKFLNCENHLKLINAYFTSVIVYRIQKFLLIHNIIKHTNFRVENC